MLVTLDVLKLKIIVVINRVMIMHHDGVRTERCENGILIDTGSVLCFMDFVQGELFITIESHASTGGIDEYDGIIPVK